MTAKFRFAPSPTGFLHVGNARLALINWLYAKKVGGEFVLRLDDTDAERSTEEYALGIQDDLQWLGLEWDDLKKQSDRNSAYEAAFEKLKAVGKLYACYETGEELDYKRKRQLARKLPPVYDRSALKLTDAEKQAYTDEGRKPHWRFLLNQEVVSWDDHVRGKVDVDCASMSDPVLIRSDGRPLYHLPSVVDDIDFDITHVIRGEDHVSNTALHIQLFKALGADAPAFAHIPLLMGPDGGPLSKREGSQSLREMRESGLDPMSINCLLARLGTSGNVIVQDDLPTIVKGFDISHFSRAAAKFDPSELRNLNAKILHEMTWKTASQKLNLASATEPFWNAVSGNLTVIDDAKLWYAVVFESITPVIEDQGFLNSASALLPSGDLTYDSWKSWTTSIKDELGVKGKALFMPLRLALTGQPHGPEMAKILPIIGRDKVLKRLHGETA